MHYVKKVKKERAKDMTTVLRNVEFSIRRTCSTINTFKSIEGMRTQFTVLERLRNILYGNDSSSLITEKDHLKFLNIRRLCVFVCSLMAV